MGEGPHGEVEDGAVAADGSEALGFAHGLLVRADDLFTSHGTVTVGGEPRREALLVVIVHRVGLARYERAPVRERQNADCSHVLFPFMIRR